MVLQHQSSKFWFFGRWSFWGSCHFCIPQFWHRVGPRQGPSPLSGQWEAFGVNQILVLCKAWSKFLVDINKWNDACEGVEAEWHEV